MRKGNSPTLLFIARIIQSIPPVFLTWIEFFIRKKKSNIFPIIFIIAPPRSGSTLTYQLLNRSTRSLYLSNLWNLFYALPYIGGKLTMDISVNKDFNSDKGLVSGLSGEAEGMKFWSYWIGQDLFEEKKEFSSKRLKYIKSVFSSLLSVNRPMISGYLGHAFSVDFLRVNFPGCMFVYLKRDELSNIYSMIKTYKEYEKVKKNFYWTSLKPIGWKDNIDKEVIDKVLWQYRSIKEKIESEISEEDTIIVDYEDICNNPHKVLKQIKECAKEHEIDLQLCLDNIPDSFHVRKVKKDKDEITKQINQLLDEK